MEDLYWIGVRESDIEGCDKLYKGSLTILGSGENGNISYSSNINERINHNSEDDEKQVNEWLNKNALEILANNPNAKFMFYNQEKIFEYDELIIKNTICSNNKCLIENINNKFLMREWLKNEIPVLKYNYYSGKEILSKRNLIQEDNNIVVQAKNSSGGYNTFLVNNRNINEVEEQLNKCDIYSVSEYCKNNIPINLHCIISKSKITLLQPSIQILKINNKINYTGTDFIEYRKIEENIKDKVKKYALRICEKLQRIGYLGVLGIDLIIYNKEVYFMEINPRFQGSTSILNIALKENKQKTINELCIEAFNNKDIEIKEIDVNYSKYVFDADEIAHELKVPYIRKQLDGFNKNQSLKRGAYKYSYIYNRNICEIHENKVMLNLYNTIYKS